MKKILTIICTLLVITGCSNRIADFTVTSTKNVNLNSEGLILGNRVEGEDGAAIILIIPTGIANLKEAVDNTIEPERCAVGLTDVVINEFAAWFLIGGYHAYQVEGTQVIDTTLQGCSDWEATIMSDMKKHK